MPLYNEENITEQVSKTRWEFAHRVELTNTPGKAPSVVFKTSTAERDNTSGEERLLEFRRALVETYTGNETFNIVDREGNVLGQADYDTLFAMLYSLFFHVAAKVDGA